MSVMAWASASRTNTPPATGAYRSRGSGGSSQLKCRDVDREGVGLRSVLCVVGAQ